MSPTGYVLVAFFVLVSGALAYWGDVVGRKLGKKRLTFGRLRPRHTAALMTALFGMLGSVVAIAALLVVSQPVRVMLFEGDRLRQQNNDLVRANKSAKEDLDRRQRELETKKNEVNSEKAKVAVEKTKLGLAQADVKTLTAFATKLKNEAAKIRQDLQSVRSQLATLKPEYERIKKEKDDAMKARQYAVDDNNKLQTQNLRLEQQIKDRVTQVGDLEKQFNTLKRDFDLLQQEYDKQARETKQNIEALRGEVTQAEKNLEDAKNELQYVKSVAAGIYSTVAASRTQPLIFSKDDELARIFVRSNLNAAEARSTVFALMDQASSIANAGSAGTVPGGKAYIILAGVDANNKPIPEETQVQTLVKRISNVDHEQVLTVNAVVNAFKGEPVGIAVRNLPNPIVYRKEQIIAETRIDGQMSQDQIVQAITKFLQENLAPKAIKDGMIPAIGQANPLGEITQEDLFKLVADIKSRQFTSRVKFVAAQDLRAGDKLKLDFRVS